MWFRSDFGTLVWVFTILGTPTVIISSRNLIPCILLPYSFLYGMTIGGDAAPPLHLVGYTFPNAYEKRDEGQEEEEKTKQKKDEGGVL